MPPSKRPLTLFTLVLALLSLFLCSGCITVPAKVYENSVTYEPTRSPIQIDASATIEVAATLSPEMRATWKRWMNNDNTITNYLGAVERSIRKDLTTSGLFTHIADGGAKADYLVKVVSLEMHGTDYRLRMTLTAIETATSTQIASHTREHSFGTSMFGYKMNEGLPALLNALKADLAADLQNLKRKQQDQLDRLQADQFAQATLPELLASFDKTEPLARARNRAIVAAKIQQLPSLVRDLKTDELTAIVVKIEQTILDLNHECEIAKDQSQQSVADDNAQLEKTRGLAICYRERIELLKPILAALKDETSNRNR